MKNAQLNVYLNVVENIHTKNVNAF